MLIANAILFSSVRFPFSWTNIVFEMTHGDDSVMCACYILGLQEIPMQLKKQTSTYACLIMQGLCFFMNWNGPMRDRM